MLRIRDVYPGSRISNPGSKNSNKSEGWKKFSRNIFFSSHKKISQNWKLFYFCNAKEKKNRASFQRIIELLTKKFVSNLSIIWIWDPDPIREQGSKIPDPGPGVKKGTGSRIRIRSTVCDWSIFSSADLSLAAGKCGRMNLSQATSGIILQNQRRFLVCILISKSPL